MKLQHKLLLLGIGTLLGLGSCKKKSYEQEKDELLGKCPSMAFFKTHQGLVDSYILEQKYNQCREELDIQKIAFGTEELTKVIARRKWLLLKGFSDCLTGEGPSKNQDSAEYTQCMRGVLIATMTDPSLKFEVLSSAERAKAKDARQIRAIVKPPEQTKKKQLEEQKQRDKEKDKQIYKPENQIKDTATAPRDARSTAQSPGQGGAGAGISRTNGPQSIGVANVLASQISAMTASLTGNNTVFGQRTDQPVPVDQIDWKAVCRIERSDVEPENGVSREGHAPIGDESLRLVSAECQRLVAKLQEAARTDFSAVHLVKALLNGEKNPVYQAEMVDYLVQLEEVKAGRGAGSSGGLGIGGGGGSGWGGIGIGGGGGLGGKLGPIGGGRRGVSMQEGAAKVVGKLDPNEVRAVIRSHRNEVHHCYQKGLVKNDKLAGNVRVVFLINPAGRAQECRVEENLAVAEVGTCICGRLTTWRFPQPEGGLAKVSYSWTLQPGG